MGRAGKKFVLLLDIDKLLSTDEIAAAAQVAEGVAAEGPAAEGAAEGDAQATAEPPAADELSS